MSSLNPAESMNGDNNTKERFGQITIIAQFFCVNCVNDIHCGSSSSHLLSSQHLADSFNSIISLFLRRQKFLRKTLKIIDINERLERSFVLTSDWRFSISRNDGIPPLETFFIIFKNLSQWWLTTSSAGWACQWARYYHIVFYIWLESRDARLLWAKKRFWDSEIEEDCVSR